jgi:Zn-dependent protease
MAIIFAFFWWASKSPITGLVVILSLSLHEAGHFLVFKFFGVDCTVHVIPPFMAYIEPIDKEIARSLSADKAAIVMLAGVTMNLGLYIIGMVLSNSIPALLGLGQELVRINFILLSINILPISFLDGGKIAWLAMSNMPNRPSREVFYFLTVVLAIIGVIGTIVGTPEANNLALFVMAIITIVFTLGVRSPKIGLPIPLWKTLLIGLAFFGFSLFNLVPFIVRMISLIPSL